MNELALIKQKYDQGCLDLLKPQLQKFLTKNRDKIAIFQKQYSDVWKRPFSLENTVKYFILHHKTIDMISEMQEETNEIKKEIAQKKALGILNEAKIKADWIQENAGIWRSHRVLEILYVFNKNPDTFLDCLL